MSEKNLQKIIDALGEDMVTVYVYDTKQGKIPVFVVQKADFKLFEQHKSLFKGEKFIMLTENDIKNWHDVFSLRFLHMRNHSDLFFGKDILGNLSLQKSDLLKTLELELRTKMIQLREDYLSKSPQQFVDEILYFMHVIWEWVLYLKDIEKIKESELISTVDMHLKCDWKIFAHLYHTKVVSKDLLHTVQHINVYLQDLCDKIDIFKL
jgi:hypothetical protein